MGIELTDGCLKVVMNECYGGFAISREAVLHMRELGSDAAKAVVVLGEKHPNGQEETCNSYYIRCERYDPILVRTVEELGEKAGGEFSKLVVNTWRVEMDIQEDDGWENGGPCFVKERF